jgi:hypothetical protein
MPRQLVVGSVVRERDGEVVQICCGLAEVHTRVEYHHLFVPDFARLYFSLCLQF